MGVLKRVERHAAGAEVHGREADDPWVSGTFPSLWEYLSVSAWPDGGARVTATVTVFVEGGRVKVCLSDRENDRSAWSTGETLEEAVLSLESALASDTVEWRFKPQERPGARRK